MQWYLFDQRELFLASDEMDLIAYSQATNTPWRHINPVSIPTLTHKQMRKLLEQLLLRLQQGWSIREALQQLTEASSSRERLCLLGLEYYLRRGHPLFTSLSKICQGELASFFALLPNFSSSQSYLIALESVMAQLDKQSSLRNQLLQAAWYPMFVMISSVLIKFALTNLGMATATFVDNIILLGIILFCGLFLLLTLSGWLPRWLNQTHQSFSLANIFALTTTQLKCGTPLHAALLNLTTLPKPATQQIELWEANLNLHNGKDLTEALPKSWFDAIGWSYIEDIRATGDSIKAFHYTYEYHQEKVACILKRVKRVAPIIGMMIAALTVANALVSIYGPLLEMNQFA